LARRNGTHVQEIVLLHTSLKKLSHQKYDLEFGIAGGGEYTLQTCIPKDHEFAGNLTERKRVRCPETHANISPQS
jgi:hypothetical protein